MKAWPTAVILLIMLSAGYCEVVSLASFLTREPGCPDGSELVNGICRKKQSNPKPIENTASTSNNVPCGGESHCGESEVFRSRKDFTSFVSKYTSTSTNSGTTKMLDLNGATTTFDAQPEAMAPEAQARSVAPSSP
jgi:hypothetical protein